MEASNTDNETETELVAEAAAEAVEAETPEPEATAEPQAADEAPAAEAEATEPEPMDDATEAEIAAEFQGEAGEEYETEAGAVAVATGPTVARVYICKHGHRTISLWTTPETCLRRVKGHICGEGVVPLADAPADAKEKMLNPLKASKKAAKKS